MSKIHTDLLNLNFLCVFMYLISVTTHTHTFTRLQNMSRTCGIDGCMNLAGLCCSRCCAVYYCSSACQRKDWKTHRRSCIPLTMLWEELGNSKNLAIEYFGPRVMVEIARRIYANVNDVDSDNKTVISVGSGLGVIEGFIKYISGLTEIICIDPDPTSWQKAPNKTSISAARGPIGLHSVAEQYPQLAGQLLPNSAESYPALCGKIDAPIRQNSISAARGPIGLHSVAEQYPQLAGQLLPNSAESYPALCGKIDAPIRQDSVAGSMYTMPSYKTVKHMLSSGDERGCNTLLINWPSPNQGSENFDLSAITELNPDNIILVVEMLGGAGSTKMLRQLSLIDGIYTGLEKEILDTLTESESSVDDGESSLQDYYLTDLIKGNNGKELTLPANFSTMDKTQKYITALAYANLTFLYSVIVLSKKPRKPTIKIDQREFKRCEVGNSVLNAYFEKMWEKVSGQSK